MRLRVWSLDAEPHSGTPLRVKKRFRGFRSLGMGLVFYRFRYAG